MMATMASRLGQVECELLSARREIVERDQHIRYNVIQVERPGALYSRAPHKLICPQNFDVLNQFAIWWNNGRAQTLIEPWVYP